MALCNMIFHVLGFTQQFFKIVLVGDSGVGKTNLLLRYTEDTFVADSKSTIGVDFSSKIVVTKSGERVKVQFWDTAGQERFKSIGLSVMRGAQGFILVYDMTCRQSFQSLTQWMNFVKDISGDDCRIIILANKSDLFNAREVRYEEAKHFASKNGVAFVETSALNGNEVSYAFEKLVEIILEQKEYVSSLNIFFDSTSHP